MKSKRGLASADQATRQRVAGEGGKVRAERMRAAKEARESVREETRDESSWPF